MLKCIKCKVHFILYILAMYIFVITLLYIYSVNGLKEDFGLFIIIINAMPMLEVLS